MRINFGKLKGRNIIYKVSPEVLKLVKPTSASVKSVLFNLMMHNSLLSDYKIQNSVVADVCCGSGSVGFEFLSLGATNCSFFDYSAQNLASVRENAKTFGVFDKIMTKSFDILNTAQAESTMSQKFDIIFFDPPYEKTKEMLQALFLAITKQQSLKNGGLLVIESEREVECADGFIKALERKVRKDRVLTFVVANEEILNTKI